jgi:hypothetical protein
MSMTGTAFDLWSAIAAPERCPPPSDTAAARAAADRLADLVSPALAQHLLAPFECRLGGPLVDPGRATKGLLLNRFTRRAQVDCARRLHEAGVPVAYIKGFASAHTLYGTPDARIAGDIDALVKKGDLPRAVTLLEAAGFRFRHGVKARWGFTATSSYVPFVSADGSCNLDLHTAPDSDPLDRALSAAQVFAEARPMDVDGMALYAPSAEHFLVIAVSNIAKDRFGPFAAKKIIDAGRLVGREPLAWARALGILDRAGLSNAAHATFALLSDLGFPGVPEAYARPPCGVAGREYAYVLAETRALYPNVESALGALRRECLLGGGWPVLVRRNARRLAGLVRPMDGTPHGRGAVA